MGFLEFHERVKAFRDEVMGMSQGDLAKSLGITQSCLSNYENGHRDYPLNILLKISEVAKISIYDLLKYTDENHPEYKRFQPYEQINLAKEIQNKMLLGFLLEYEPFMAKNSGVRDLITLLAKLPKKELEEYIKEQKKDLVSRIKKQN